MVPQSFQFQGEALLADPSGALYWPDQRLLVVSDLHFEKGSSFARKGVMLPPYDTRATLDLLEQVITRYEPHKILSLGDAFHDRAAEARIREEDAAMLERLTSEYRWIWILGNHDPEPPKRFKGEVHTALTIGPLTFCHEASRGPNAASMPGEVSGHYHPAAKIMAEHRTLRRRCFVMDHQRLIMPSMGAFTGGLNVLDEALSSLFPDDIHVLALSGSQVFSIPRRHLLADTKTAPAFV